MILVRMINDLNKGLCSFVFLDEEYTVTPVYYMVDNFHVKKGNDGEIEEVHATVNASLYYKGKGFVKDENFTIAMTENMYSALLDISVRLFLNSYEKLGDSRVH
jgi:hypothetical protein